MANLDGWNSSNRIGIYVDHTKIDEDLTDFPLSLIISASGTAGIDYTPVFDELSETIEGYSFKDQIDDNLIDPLSITSYGDFVYVIDASGGPAVVRVFNAITREYISSWSCINDPKDICTDGTNIYVCAWTDTTIRKYGMDGTDLGEFTTVSRQFGRITTRDGYVYTTYGTAGFCGFNSSGTELFNYSSWGGGNYSWQNIRGLDTDSNYIYIADSGNHRIVMYDLVTGIYHSSEYGSQFNGASDVFINTTLDRMYVASDWGVTGRKVTINTIGGVYLDEIPSTGEFTSVRSITYIHNKLWCCDSGLNAILIYHTLDWTTNNKKIAITTSDGITQCPVEIDTWVADDTITNIWFKAPSINSSEDTNFYLYYDLTQPDNTSYIGDTGDVVAQGVWDNNFEIVHHFTGDPSVDNMIDSTSNVRDANPIGSTHANINAPLGEGIDMSDINTFGCSLVDTVLGMNGLTVEVNYAKNVNDNPACFIHNGEDSTFLRRWRLMQDTTYGLYVVMSRDGSSTDQHFLGVNPADAFDGEFHNFTYQYDGSTADSEIFYDGVKILPGGYSRNLGTVPISMVDSISVDTYIGTYQGLDNFFKGQIDEIRVSNIKRSDAWLMATQFSNTNTLMLKITKDIKYWQNNNYGYEYAIDENNDLLFKTSSQSVSSSADIDTWYTYDATSLAVSGSIESIKVLSDKVYVKTNINNFVAMDYGLDAVVIPVSFSIDDADCYFYDFIENDSRLILDRGTTIEIRDSSTYQKIASSVTKPIGHTETIKYVVKKSSTDYLIINENSVGYILNIGTNEYSLHGSPNTYDIYVGANETTYNVFSVSDNVFTLLKYNTTSGNLIGSYLYFDSNNVMSHASTILSTNFTEVNDIYKYSNQSLILGNNNFAIYDLENRDISSFSYPTSGYDYKKIFYLDKFYIKRYTVEKDLDFAKILGFNSFRENIYKSHYFDLMVNVASITDLETEMSISELGDFIGGLIPVAKPVHTELLNLLMVAAGISDNIANSDYLTELPISSGGPELTLTMTAKFDGIHPWKKDTIAKPMYYNNDGLNNRPVVRYGATSFSFDVGDSTVELDSLIHENIPL